MLSSAPHVANLLLALLVLNFPFAFPEGWRPVNDAPVPVVSWKNGESEFDITFESDTISPEKASAELPSDLARQGATLGSASQPVPAMACGKPAARITIATAAGTTIEEQAQFADRGFYVSMYERPAATAADPAIASAFAAFCGATSTGRFAPPSGWTLMQRRLETVIEHRDPSEKLALLSRAGAAAAGAFTGEPTTEVLVGDRMSVTSSAPATYCGNAGTLAIGHSRGRDGDGDYEIRVAVAPAPKITYALVYEHRTGGTVSDDAQKALASLCNADQSAGSAAALPFVPPYGWKTETVGRLLGNVSWTDGRSDFDSLEVSPGDLRETLASGLPDRAKLIGRRTLNVCGGVAERASATLTSGQIATYQVQTTAKGTYSSSYVRDPGAASDATMLHELDTFCGTADATPPQGWFAVDETVLGGWAIPDHDHVQTIALTTRKPLIAARAALLSRLALDPARTTMVTTTICGRPATVFRTIPADQYGRIRQIEIETSGDRSWELEFTHAPGNEPGPGAAESLMSFCVPGAL